LEDTFSETEVPVPGGGSTQMKLAMQQKTISSGDACIPVTEVRRLTKTGHQTAVISTARILDTPVIAGRMFSRWCQENFFAYMMQHYDIDGLIQYGTGAVPGTLLVINPLWRDLDRAVKKALQEVRKYAAILGMHKSLDDNEGCNIQKKAEYVQDMQAAQLELEQLRAKRKQTKKKVTIDSLAENQRPTQLLPLNKQLSDTVKMIAYRAETAMVNILPRHLKNVEEARALVRELFVSSADIEPDCSANTITIRIHRMASPAHD
jgi:hypothetical protein